MLAAMDIVVSVSPSWVKTDPNNAVSSGSKPLDRAIAAAVTLNAISVPFATILLTPYTICGMGRD